MFSYLQDMSQQDDLDACFHKLGVADSLGLADVIRDSFQVATVDDLGELARASVQELVAVTLSPVTPVRPLLIKRLLKSPEHVRAAAGQDAAALCTRAAEASSPSSAAELNPRSAEQSQTSKSCFVLAHDIPPMEASVEWSTVSEARIRMKGSFKNHMKQHGVPVKGCYNLALQDAMVEIPVGR